MLDLIPLAGDAPMMPVEGGPLMRVGCRRVICRASRRSQFGICGRESR